MNSRTPQVALLTPPGEGGIGVIAVWGPGATGVLERVFVGTRRAAGALRRGAVAHGTARRHGEVLDEVIVARVSPVSPALDEPCYEVNCHGGVAAVRAVMDRLAEAGAERSEGTPPAGPPLSAQCIRDRALAALPQAATRLSVLMLLHQAEGALASEVGLLAGLLHRGEAHSARACLSGLLETASLGRALMEPRRVALLGPPNAGKSTLFNALLGEERVIMHEEPGTTRDIVSEVVSVRGVPFRMLDAAGIGPAVGELERRAVERARALGEQCDVAVAVFDVRERADLALLPPLRADARIITVLNKMDLVDDARAAEVTGDGPVVCISAKEHANIAQLEEALLEPYRALIPRCRARGAVVFHEEQTQALRCIAQVLHAEGTGSTTDLLEDLAGRTPSL